MRKIREEEKDSDVLDDLRLLRNEEIAKDKPIEPEIIVTDKRISKDVQKSEIKTKAMDYLEKIVNDEDLPVRDKRWAVEMVLKPEFPNTSINMNTNLDKMGTDEVIAFIKGMVGR